MPPRFVPLLFIGPMLGLSWVVLALFDPDGLGGRLAEYVGLGYLFGTLFGQTTLAAAWTALGPFPKLWRLVAAPCWLFMLWFCLVGNVALHRGPNDFGIIVLIGCCLVGQWLLVLVPLVGLALGYRLQLVHRDDIPAEENVARPRQLQFGIRQLMILTAIVAVVLGALRWLVLALVARLGERGMGEAPVFIFLAVAAVIMTLPLVMALLLPRWWIPATVAVLALAALATSWETTLLALLPRTPGPDMGHFIFINAFTGTWIVIVLGAMRLFGYGLASTSLGLVPVPGNTIQPTIAKPAA